MGYRMEQVNKQLRMVTLEKEELENSVQKLYDQLTRRTDDNDNLRYKCSEIQRERDRLKEKLATINPSNFTSCMI